MMTVYCAEKSRCGFRRDREVCTYCQTRLRGVDRELQVITRGGSQYVGAWNFQERRRKERVQVIWTF